MTDLPDQNQSRPLNPNARPSTPAQNSAPPWVDSQGPPSQSNQTSTPPVIEPTIEPIIEKESSKPSLPQEPTAPPLESTTTPAVYNPDDKGKKILKASGIVFSIFFLSSLTYFSLNYLDKKRVEKPAKKPAVVVTSASPVPQIQVQLPTKVKSINRKGNFALSVNGEVLSWNEYEEFLNYSLKQARSNVNDPDVRKKINESLVERLLLINTTKQLGITIRNEEVEKLAEDIYCSSDNKCHVSEEFKNNPHTKKIIEGLIYKQKIIENLVSLVNGGYILIQMGGRRVEETASKKGMEAKQLAMETITPYYEKAKAGESIKTLIVKMEKDPQVLELNGSSSQPYLLETYTREPNPPKQAYWEDPQFIETAFSLTQGETSDIFVLKVPNDRKKDTWIDYGYIFIKVEEVSQGQFDTYQDWLDSALKQAEIISNL